MDTASKVMLILLSAPLFAMHAWLTRSYISECGWRNVPAAIALTQEFAIVVCIGLYLTIT